MKNIKLYEEYNELGYEEFYFLVNYTNKLTIDHFQEFSQREVNYLTNIIRNKLGMTYFKYISKFELSNFCSFNWVIILRNDDDYHIDSDDDIKWKNEWQGVISRNIDESKIRNKEIKFRFEFTKHIITHQVRASILKDFDGFYYVSFSCNGYNLYFKCDQEVSLINCLERESDFHLHGLNFY